MNKLMFKAVIAFGLLACSLTASHARTSQYVVDNNQNFNISSDGRNTYIEAIPGLIIKGATADGDRLIVAGNPDRIYGNFAGRPIIISRAIEPGYQQGQETATPALKSRLDRLEAALKVKEGEYAEKSGKPASATVATQAKVTPPVVALTWEIRKTDGTLYGALTRWAESATPKRQLIFATESHDYAADPEATFTGDFDAAITAVMESHKNSSYPLRACFWENSPRPVVKIIHKNKRCED